MGVRYDEDNPPPGQPEEGTTRRDWSDGSYSVFRGGAWIPLDEDG